MDWVRGNSIGHGTFSTVSVAAPAKDSSGFPARFAVKSADAYGQDSLKNEKFVLDSLGDCPEIVRCFGEDRTIEDGVEFYNLFLEYASQGCLASQIAGENLPESTVRRHTQSVLKGLRHIHSRGFAHCDIKPGNILMFDDGSVKIADFGLAKSNGKFNGELTAPSGVQIRGTPLYMAPESVNDDEYDSPADIWALGCSVVEMASGKTAWSFKEGSNFMSLLIRIGVGDDLPRIPDELSEDGKDFLRMCFVKDPRKRWTAEMLLSHPFVAGDHDEEQEQEQEKKSTGETTGWGKNQPTSPICPFDFPDWVSSISCGSPVFNPPSDLAVINFPVSNLPLDSPEKRIESLVTDLRPDWSVTEDWVTVRDRSS